MTMAVLKNILVKAVRNNSSNTGLLRQEGYDDAPSLIKKNIKNLPNIPVYLQSHWT